MILRRIQSLQHCLVAAIVTITVLGEVSVTSRLIGQQSLNVGMTVGYGLVLANIAVALAGMFYTRHAVAWLLYLLVSVVSTVLIGTATPLSIVGIVARLLL